MSADHHKQILQTPCDFGLYYVERELGHGGMGSVYLATDKMLQRRVALKVMLRDYSSDADFVRRFQREAQAAACMNNPYVVQVYAFGKEGDLPYIAMEFVGGGSLGAEIKDAGGAGLDPLHVMRVGWQIAQGLDCAAEHHLLHGDLKPDNVLYDDERRAKLADFGLAAMQGNANEIWGTPFYVSPEVLRRKNVDFRADMFSFGCTLYHALTGQPPFDGPDALAVLKARFKGPPLRPSEVCPGICSAIDEIIMRMIQKDPAMRYPSYEPLLADFKVYLRQAIAERKRQQEEEARAQAEKNRASHTGMIRLSETRQLQAPVDNPTATRRFKPAPFRIFHLPKMQKDLTEYGK